MAHYIEKAELYFNTRMSESVEVVKDRLALLFKLCDVQIDLDDYHQQLIEDPVIQAVPVRYVKHLAMLVGKALPGHVVPQGDQGSHWYRVASDLEIILVYQYAIELGCGSAANRAIKQAIQRRLSTHPNGRLYADHIIEVLGACGY